MRVERGTARETGKYRDHALARYTPDGIDAIAEEYRTESIRSDEPLHCDDVAVGDRIPSTGRGPYTAEAPRRTPADSGEWCLGVSGLRRAPTASVASPGCRRASG